MSIKYECTTVGQTSRSRLLGQKAWYVVKSLVARNAQMQCESSVYTGSELMAKVNIFEE